MGPLNVIWESDWSVKRERERGEGDGTSGGGKKKRGGTQLNVMSCCKRWPPRSRRSIILYKDEISSILLVEDTID